MRFFALLIALSAFHSSASANPPLEAYGQLPSFRSVALSPSGTRVAFLGRNGAVEYAAVFDYRSQSSVSAVNLEDAKTRSVYFVSEDFAILRASETTRVRRFRGEFEYSAAFAWDLKTEKIGRLPRYGVDLFPAQTGLGRIIGKVRGEDTVFIPAYVGPATSSPDYSLLKVDLETGRARVHAKGSTHTRDWIVDDDGEVIAREDFNDKSDRYSIWVRDGSNYRKIYEEETEVPTMSLLGVTPDKSTLLVSVQYEDDERNAIVGLTRDGKLTEPLFAREDADVERLLSSINRVVHGVEYSGMTPSYEFLGRPEFDPIAAVQPLFPAASIVIEDFSEDFDRFVLYVSGGANSPAFHVYDRPKQTLARIAGAYEGIADAEIGEVFVIETKARDGEKIPSILTLPPGAEMTARHPAIIMPHGGPQSYDAIGFDWLAQFFANRGFAVLQPNFRGSDGFGASFEKAGHGQWGRGVMQHDVTDAVGALVRGGIADPERICIVGASYGGYAALAGGAFTPDLYKCVAAFAPVSDLPIMLIDERRDYGRDSWVLSYWEKRIGDINEERAFLESISPSEYADEFTAPVLLLHGNDDTVVPFRQSLIMERALKRAGKDVELIKLSGGDHWLSTSETRLEMLRSLDAFVSEHIGGPVN